MANLCSRSLKSSLEDKVQFYREKMFDADSDTDRSYFEGKMELAKDLLDDLKWTDQFKRRSVWTLLYGKYKKGGSK